MNGSTEEKADCYSAGERGAMVWFQQLRASSLGPLLRLLVALKVHPDHVTLASLAAGLAFCPLYLNFPLAAGPSSRTPCVVGWPGRTFGTFRRRRLPTWFVHGFDG